MQASDDRPGASPNRRRSPARARMVRSAATLMRERGIHGVGLREIVVHSGGPRGSLGRYFPGGKTQLMTEAIDVVVGEISAEVDEELTQAKTFPDAIGAIIAPWRRLLVDHDFALGCPLAATVVDAADNDQLRVHVNELLTQWQASVADVYTRFGDPPSVAAAADDGASGCDRGRAHPRSRATQHRAPRHGGALLRDPTSSVGGVARTTRVLSSG